MTVTFCGHRQMEHGAEVTAWLRNVVEDLIREGAVTFYLGGMGALTAWQPRWCGRARRAIPKSSWSWCWPI